MVVFPDPSVTVQCGIVINPEPCPIPVDLTIDGCQDSVVVDTGDTYLGSLGRILQLDVTEKTSVPESGLRWRSSSPRLIPKALNISAE